MSLDLRLSSDRREIGSGVRAAGIVVEIQAAEKGAMPIVPSVEAAASFVTLAHEEVQGFLSRRVSF